jgi:pimeloyl-ACP methyl ester carboxylesterase
VVLVGHSKGGAAALLTALRYPELVLTGVIDRVVVVQGAIGGSPLADAIARSAAVRALPLPRRGLASLTPSEARSLFQEELSRVRARITADGLERLFARVFYVRSWEGRGRTSFELALTHEYLQGFGSGQNDGLLLQEDMKLDRAGVDLGVVASDHASLTVAGLLSKSTTADRKAFTRALFREIYEGDASLQPRPVASAR